MANIEVSRRLTEQVQETLRASNNNSATILSDLLEQVGGIQALNEKQKGSLVATLRQIHQDQRTDVTDEVRNHARDLAVLVDREKFIQGFANTPVTENRAWKWTKRAAGLTAALVAGGAGATLIGADNLGVLANKIGEGAGWAWNNLVPSTDTTLSVLGHPAAAYGIAGTTVAGAYGVSKLRNNTEPVQAKTNKSQPATRDLRTRPEFDGNAEEVNDLPYYRSRGEVPVLQGTTLSQMKGYVEQRKFKFIHSHNTVRGITGYMGRLIGKKNEKGKMKVMWVVPRRDGSIAFESIFTGEAQRVTPVDDVAKRLLGGVEPPLPLVA